MMASQINKLNSPANQRSISSFVGLVGLRLRNADTKTLVSKTAQRRSVTFPIPFDSRTLRDSLTAYPLTHCQEPAGKLLTRQAL